VSRGIPRICRGEPRNLANGAAEFGKICRGKLWSLLMRTSWYYYVLPVNANIFETRQLFLIVCRVYALCVWRNCSPLNVFSQELSAENRVPFHWISLCHFWRNVFRL